ncbi:hypothetical protein [Jannaschia rubra]|uniref:hypothetical protein n=1 Tax=Jannaschia rubra TaxID=282197 RepID=UPI002492DFAD|nr:hypothetical protein [Jannaschia rubra]
MVPENKILTVAYGTFSCTLEGFDDPFSTMTEIAEYFRDLAAGDRFFGAEPPTPDMATLRGIAETRAKQSVNARSGDNGIVLSPSLAEAGQTVDDALARSSKSKEHVARREAREDTRENLFDDAAFSTIEDEPESAVHGVSETLARVRNVARSGRTPSHDDIIDAEPVWEDTEEEDVEAPQPEEEPVAANDTDGPSDDVAFAEEDIALEDRGVESDELEAEDDFAEQPEHAASLQETAAPPSIRVRKIRRIETAEAAVVTMRHAEVDDDAGESDDDHSLTCLSHEVPAGNDIDDDLTGDLSGLASEEGPLDDDLLEEDDDSDILAGIFDDDPDEEDLVAAIRQDVAAETNAYPAAYEDLDDQALTEDAAEEDKIVLRDHDEKGARTKSGVATPLVRDMERLFAATDSRLSGEDTSRRHANISHLKAAVAARRADGPIPQRQSDDTGAYRADLASTVRPRRAPEQTEARTARPERSAPLVLVSEQRVEEAPAAERPVAPRRPHRDIETDDGEQVRACAEDFERFAAEVGAADLPEILEAAAVYTAEVLGQDNFSRPRLLHLASEAVEDLSREDGLRGFGQLLRDGTIRKVSRGTFALGAESRYSDPSARRFG